MQSGKAMLLPGKDASATTHALGKKRSICSAIHCRFYRCVCRYAGSPQTGDERTCGRCDFGSFSPPACGTGYLAQLMPSLQLALCESPWILSFNIDEPNAEFIRREDRKMFSYSKVFGGLAIAIAALFLTIPIFSVTAGNAATAACCCGEDCECPECGCIAGLCTSCQCPACSCDGCGCGEDCGSPCCPTSIQEKNGGDCCKEKSVGTESPADDKAGCCSA